VTARVIIPLPGNEALAHSLAGTLDAEIGQVSVRRFPDQESYIRVDTPVAGSDIVVACSLHRPDDKVLQLSFLASTLRELGAQRIGLVAPYLAYMRQDRRFREGEAVTSTHFARLLSRMVDWLVTVDPHLHRRSSLAEIYSIPTNVLHAAPRIADWIAQNIPEAVLVGPDAESSQWVQAVAEMARAPSIVLQKQRRGDRDVSVSVPHLDRWRDHTPVLVDDIISTARTMIATVAHLRRVGLPAPVCVGVHAVFADKAYDELRAAGAERVVTCNTISHASNAIDITSLLVSGIKPVLESNRSAARIHIAESKS
jgi:ribose-phosphate pyrophosphokinase